MTINYITKLPLESFIVNDNYNLKMSVIYYTNYLGSIIYSQLTI